jgi:hypothetical protein
MTEVRGQITDGGGQMMENRNWNSEGEQAGIEY